MKPADNYLIYDVFLKKKKWILRKKLGREYKERIYFMTVPKRKCPEYKNWEFDDESHWCKIEFRRITYTSITLPTNENNILECEDFVPLEDNSKRKKNKYTR
jgi:hypothetical protein